MAQFPQKPRTGEKVLQGLYNSVCQIIDYLPTLEVKGDNSSTSVTKTSNGTIVHASDNSRKLSEGRNYMAYHGVELEEGIAFYCSLSGGKYITIDYYGQDEQGEQVLLLNPLVNCTLSGGRDIQITPQGVINYTGSGGGSGGIEYFDGRFISISSDYTINCTLSSLLELYNPPISGEYIGTEPHFVQVQNLHDGAGTSIDYHWNSIGDSTEEGGQLIKFIDGICVNLNVSGGQYVTTKFHQGVGYGDYTSASIDCNLSGDHQVYNTGLITIIPQYDSSYNITGGVISSILHAGSGLSIDYGTGEISLTGSISPGPTPVGTFYAPDYAKFSTSQDVGHLIGLGTTFTLPVSKGSTLRFDSAVASATVGVWAPVEGSTSNAFLLTSSNSNGTPDDGYVRISVIDEGLISAGCLRLYVNDHDIPLHKFAKFNQGKVYDAGRYMQIQTTSTRINQQDQEQTYDLQNPLIHNMLTGGRFITIQQTEMINGTETQLRYPRINCDLTEGSNISISSAGVISVTGITNNIPTPVANTVLSATAGGQMAWTPNTGGGGGPVTYVSGFYPNWGHGNHDSVVIPSNDSYSAPPFTMAQNGWIYAWASFNPSYDGFRYSSYRAHVIVGGAWFKVCELLLPFQKAELTLSSSSNIASQVPNGNYTRYPEGDVTNKFYLSGTYYDQQKEENIDFMVQCTRNEGDDQYETLYDGNDDQSGRNYTKFAWSVSNRPTENLPNVLYTNDQFITSNSYYDIYYKDQNDDFQPLYYLDGISNTMGKKSEDYTYFAWKNGNNDIVFSRRYGGMHQNIGAPTEYSISTLIYNYQNYIEYQETPLTSNRINFQNVYDNTENDYWVKATASNVSDIAIGVGAAITIPARKGKNVQFKVETDNNGTYSVPISYGQQYGAGPFPVACVVYYDNPPEE